jgi:ATP-dependent protease ClpP protease subunit
LQNYKREIENLVAKGMPAEKPDWYAIRNEADSSAEIFIYEEIGYWGITSDDFVRDLSALKAKTINLRINSPGGSVWDAIAIYNALVQHTATINVTIDALAASAASVIAMAGDKITMMRGSQMMIHDASGIGIGNEAELKEYASWLGRQSDNIASIYEARSSALTAEEWRGKMLAETWMFADEAVECGLADEVFTPQKPMPEEEDPAEEEEDTEDEGEEDTPDEATPEDRIRARHRLSNRGYKYPGRKQAPEPTNGIDIDALCAAMGRVLEGK